METTDLVKRVGSGSDAFGTVLDVMEAFDVNALDGLDTPNMVLGLMANFADNQVKGHGVAESAGDTAAKQLSGTAAERLGVKTTTGTAINFINDLAGAVLPKQVSDVTGLAADVTPEKFLENLMRQGTRGVTNVIAGDDAALERQQQEMLAGEAGTPLQGYASTYEAFDRMEGGESPETALIAAGDGMEDTVVEEVYEAVLGEDDAALSQKIPESGEFQATSGNAVLDFVCRDLIGL